MADYAPSAGDVVGVGSDTVQYASDFAADGDHLGDVGYNGLGNLNHLVNLDATPDANARLAYGAGGNGSVCAPGTGTTKGTGNQLTTHTTDTPCVLNPTVVLRAGTLPVLRPNGSGSGFAAMLADTGTRNIDYSRASSKQIKGATTTGMDSIQIGSDPLAILTATTTNAVSLSAAQLKDIYNCVATTWSQVGSTGTNSGHTIIPVIPQVGSGTRTSFLAAISVTTPGACVVTAEENDPTVLDAQTSAADAIVPMSGGRLNLFKGLIPTDSAGTTIKNNGTSTLPYFQDPSCPLKTTAAACASPAIVPNVKLDTSGVPSVGALFNISRPLFIYFRDADINSTTMFQPGGTLNFVRALFYNPCQTGQTWCQTIGGSTYGPGGQPFYATSAGQSLIAAAGIFPTYVPVLAGP